MDIILNPPVAEWPKLAERNIPADDDIARSVQQIVSRVRRQGDAALYDFARQFDGAELDTLEVTQAELQQAEEAVAPEVKQAMQQVRDMLAGYDTYVDTQVGVDASADLEKEMGMIIVVAAIIIVAVLTLTSRTYAEIPVLVMTFGAAAILNKGTNFLCGKISFISNSVTVVLQLALAIDYAIILCHRFSDEHETKPTREACIAALAKAIPEISSSSLMVKGASSGYAPS